MAAIKNTKETKLSETACKFKNYWVQLPYVYAIDVQNRIKANLGWTVAIWYNKIHGITAITENEKNVIAEILNDKHENIF